MAYFPSMSTLLEVSQHIPGVMMRHYSMLEQVVSNFQEFWATAKSEHDQNELLCIFIFDLLSLNKNDYYGFIHPYYWAFIQQDIISLAQRLNKVLKALFQVPAINLIDCSGGSKSTIWFQPPRFRHAL